MFSFFLFCVICSCVGWWRNGIVEKIQEKLPENGDFMAFLHWLFSNCFLILTRVNVDNQCGNATHKASVLVPYAIRYMLLFLTIEYSAIFSYGKTIV